jgi:hypothetical protein
VSAPRAADLLFLHARLAELLRLPSGVRDVPALRRAIAEAAAADSGDLYADAAGLAHALYSARPFLAANAAHAVVSAALLLREYDLGLDLPLDELPALRGALAADDTAALAAWLRAHSAPLPLPG